MAESNEDIIIIFPEETEEKIMDLSNSFQINPSNTTNAFLKYCEKESEAVIHDKIIETTCYKDEKKYKNKMHVLAYKLKHAKHIGYIIKTEIPFNLTNEAKMANVHPFRLISKKIQIEEDKNNGGIISIGEIVPDNEMTRMLLDHLTDMEKLKEYGTTKKTDTIARIIKALSLFWD